MRKYWSTTYTVKSRTNPDGVVYSSYILAYNFEEAISILEKRKLNEEIDTVEGTIVKPKMTMIHPLTLFIRLNRTTRVVDRHRDIKTLMHMCCFLLHLNTCKALPIPDVFSDIGLMHQLLHALLVPKAELGYDYYNLDVVVKILGDNHPEMFLTKEEENIMAREFSK